MTLKPLTSNVHGDIAHGFFTRLGGVSKGIYKGLNCGAGSDDQPKRVQQNRALVAGHLGVNPDHLISLHQVHSPDVFHVSGPQQSPKPKMDAMVTDRPGFALAVLSADCQPVLFSDRAAGVIGAAHAGWKGALDGVLEATLDAMEALGAERTRINAAIGPCISQSAYEVGPEFSLPFCARDPRDARFFGAGHGDRQQFDLPGYSLARLKNAGVARAVWTGHCTYGDAARYYSYRRATHAGEPDYGRLISAIRL